MTIDHSKTRQHRTSGRNDEKMVARHTPTPASSMKGAVFAPEGTLIAAPHSGVNVREVADTASVCSVRGAPLMSNGRPPAQVECSWHDWGSLGQPARCYPRRAPQCWAPPPRPRRLTVGVTQRDREFLLSLKAAVVALILCFCRTLWNFGKKQAAAVSAQSA